jgi:uncharacterized protein (TIGR02266 family)
MPCRIRDAGKVTILDIEGNVDINSSDIIETVGWLLGTGKLQILCNMENVDMADYNGISILTIAYKNVINHKGRMKFLNVPLPVMELFKLVRLDMLFECYYDESAAVASFSEVASEITKMHLRRRFTRLDIHLKVKYSLAGGQKAPAVFSAEVLNISGSGIFVYTANTFPINSPLNLELNLPGEADRLEVAGKVVWLPDQELQPHSYPGMGIAFTHLSNRAERLIVDFVEKNITHRAEG